MKNWVLFISLFIIININAQDVQINYRDCNLCPIAVGSNPALSTALYIYDNNSAYNTGNIESDFDLRRRGSRWYKGIDLRNHGAGDNVINQRGDAIINPDENAVITQFDHEGYKWMGINGMVELILILQTMIKETICVILFWRLKLGQLLI